LHPLDLEEIHLDGSVSPEVPGKSSNLKWAVNVGRERSVGDGVTEGNIVLTVGDADCIFHPSYFDQVGHEFRELKATTGIDSSGSQRPWTLWQAPQLSFRNYYECLPPARIWGYVQTVYEFGGVGGLLHGGFHMTFSSFSLPLELVSEALPWDGDVIADDHHCFLKCFLYSVYNQACKHAKVGGSGGIDPPLVVRPVMLPVKSTAVVADGCLPSWAARFEQAKRHSQGVAEMSYVLLAVCRLWRTLPRSAYSWALAIKVCRVVLLPFSINLLPICQAIPMAGVTISWFLGGGELPQCPSSMWLQRDLAFYGCFVAGGLNTCMMLPVLVLIILANFYMLDTCFVRPGCRASMSSADVPPLWYRQDGGVAPQFGSKRLTALGLVACDVALIAPPIMAIYGLIPQVMAYWNCLVRGNRFDFISATKVASSGKTDSPQLGPSRPVELPQVIVGRSKEDDEDVRLRTQSSVGSFVRP